jgi:hypothetical protein
VAVITRGNVMLVGGDCGLDGEDRDQDERDGEDACEHFPDDWKAAELTQISHLLRVRRGVAKEVSEK